MPTSDDAETGYYEKCCLVKEFTIDELNNYCMKHHVYEFEELINKPSTTTNEQPLGLHLAITKILIDEVENDTFEAQFPKHINKACMRVTDRIVAKLKEYRLIV